MAKTTPIPTASRNTVMQRDQRCVRCAAGGPMHWHHRRSRRVRGEHQHCPCNGVLLCSPCHNRVHGSVAEARDSGLIVSSFIDEPATIPVKTWRGWLTHDCAGNWAQFPPREGTT